MLNSLLIQNIVLIEKLEIQMADGLCVLSGETGSGKSILLDALGLATGTRSNSRLLKEGAKQGMAIANFSINNNKACQKLLQENGLTNPEDENSLTLRRILLENGSSKAFANDIPIGVNLLNEIGSSLIEIHGQHQQKGLLNAAYHRVILDKYAKAGELLKQVGSAYEEWRNIEKRIAEINANKARNERERDYLAHIVKELETANIQIGEEDELIEKRNLLNSKTQINQIIQTLTTELNDTDGKLSSIQNLLIRNQSLGNAINAGDGKGNPFEQLTEIIDQTITKNDEARQIIDSIANSFDESSFTLEEVEERLFTIRNLSRKFNQPIDELPAFLQEAAQKLDELENFESLTHDLEAKAEQVKSTYLAKAQELSALRKKEAQRLGNAVQSELAFLKMANVKFEVNITKLEESNYSQSGIDQIRFIAATNPNSSLDDISKIASGGELSRFMLALKVALSEVKSVPSLIFDEIDTGIGGAVANAVGERLKLLSKKLQIMVVTHHAQVASKANYNLRVQKTQDSVASTVLVEILDNAKKEAEIARMLSGEEISDEALAAAKKLISG